MGFNVTVDAITENISPDTFSGVWYSNFISQTSNKGDIRHSEYLNIVKQNGGWGSGTINYRLPNDGRNTTIPTRYEFSSGGSHGWVWPKITTPWANRRVILRTVTGKHTLNTDSNGITQGHTGQNQPMNYPTSVELENEPNTRLRVEQDGQSRRIVIYKAIEENDMISVWTNAINMGVKILYHNGRSGFGVTDINGWMSIKNKTNRDDPNRWFKMIPMVGTSFNESYPFPIAYSYQGHAAMFDTVFNDTDIILSKDVNKGPTIFNIISIEVNGTVKTITLSVSKVKIYGNDPDKLYLLDEVSGIQVETDQGRYIQRQYNIIVARIDTPTNILRIRIKRGISNRIADNGKYFHGVPTSIIL